MKPYTVTFEAYGNVEREVKNSGSSGRVFVPKNWVGKKVQVILLEAPAEE